MKILDAGHKYQLDQLDSLQNAEPLLLRFVKREGENFPFNKGSYGGTNCQEVLRVLIDRSKYLQRQKPCAETEAIIASLEAALLLFEVRASRRHGLQLDVRSLADLSSMGTCKECGHIQCEHQQ